MLSDSKSLELLADSPLSTWTRQAALPGGRQELPLQAHWPCVSQPQLTHGKSWSAEAAVGSVCYGQSLRVTAQVLVSPWVQTPLDYEGLFIHESREQLAVAQGGHDTLTQGRHFSFGKIRSPS